MSYHWLFQTIAIAPVGANPVAVGDDRITVGGGCVAVFAGNALSVDAKRWIDGVLRGSAQGWRGDVNVLSMVIAARD